MDSKEKRENREKKRKREMANLRETLLNGRESPADEVEEKEEKEERKYLDRSAMRRKIHPPTPPPRVPRNKYHTPLQRAEIQHLVRRVKLYWR